MVKNKKKAPDEPAVLDAAAPQSSALEHERRLRFLAESPQVLNASLNHRETLEALARLSIPHFADYCLVADVSPQGQIEVVAAHADPNRESLLDELTARPLSDSRSLALKALHTGKPQTAFTISDDDLRAAAQDSKQLRVLRALQPRSSIFVPLIGRERTRGVIGFAYAESGRVYSPDDVPFAMQFAQRAALAVENAYLYSAASAAEEAARRHSLHLEVLSEASNALVNAGLDLKGVLDTVARRVAEKIGDVFVIGLLNDDRNLLESVSASHPRSRQRALLRRLQRIPRPASEGLSGLVLDRNEPLLIPRTSREEMLERAAGRYKAYIERYGVSSVLAVPLRTSEGPIGVLFLARDEGGEPYTEDDQGLLVELAARTAQAVENARLYQAEHDARRAAEHAAWRMGILQGLTATLASARNQAEVVRFSIRHSVDALGAKGGAIALVDEPSGDLQVVGSLGYPKALIRTWKRFPMSLKSPMTDAIKQLAPIALGSADEVSRAYPKLGEDKRSRNQAFIAIPLINEGRAIGVLGLTFSERRLFPQDDRDFVMAVGSQCAQAMERVRLYEAQQAARRAAEHAFRRTESLQGVTSALADCRSGREVALVAVREGRKAMDADAAWLAMLDSSRHSLRVLAREGYRDEAVERWEEIPLDLSTPVTHAALKGRPFWYSTLEAMYKDYPLLRDAIDDQFQGLAGIPLHGKDHSVGVLCLSFREVREFNAADRSFISSLAQQCALAFERTRLTEETDGYNRRLKALAAATAEFAEAALDVDKLAGTIARCVGDLIGDGCVVRLLEPSAQVYRQAAVYDPDPNRQAAILELGSADQPAGQGISRVLEETGQPILMPTVGPDELSRIAEPYRSYITKNPIYSFMAAPLQSRGRLIGTIGVSSMSPDRKYGPTDQQFLVELADRAALAMDNAQLFAQSEHALIARNRFLSMASHELKTPITSVKGYTQLLLRRAEEGADKSTAEVLSVIDSEADRMTRLINELLDIARIERGRLEFELEPVDLNEAVRDSISNVAMTAGDFDFNLRAVTSEAVVIGDRMRLEQVVTNMLTNAVRYSRDLRRADITLTTSNGNAQIEVKDYGIGIPGDQQSNVFDLFFRGSNLGSEAHGGMGLGLFICNAIVREHGGAITIDSREGEGSTFTINIPLAQTAPEVP